MFPAYAGICNYCDATRSLQFLLTWADIPVQKYVPNQKGSLSIIHCETSSGLVGNFAHSGTICPATSAAVPARWFALCHIDHLPCWSSYENGFLVFLTEPKWCFQRVIAWAAGFPLACCSTSLKFECFRGSKTFWAISAILSLKEWCLDDPSHLMLPAVVLPSSRQSEFSLQPPSSTPVFMEKCIWVTALHKRFIQKLVVLTANSSRLKTVKVAQ